MSVKTNLDPEEIDLEEDCIKYEEIANNQDDIVVEFDDDNLENNEFPTISRLMINYFGLFVGGIMLGVGLSGDLEGSKKTSTLIVGGGLTAFTLVKSIKNTLDIYEYKKEEEKQLELRKN